MNNSFYNDFAARFAAGTLTSLVESFNGQVGKRGLSGKVLGMFFCFIVFCIFAL